MSQVLGVVSRWLGWWTKGVSRSDAWRSLR